MPRTGGLTPRLPRLPSGLGGGGAMRSGADFGGLVCVGLASGLLPGLRRTSASCSSGGESGPAISFWPSALAEGGAVEEWLTPGVDLGPGAYVDWHAPEATYARKLRESQRHRGLSVFRG